MRRIVVLGAGISGLRIATEISKYGQVIVVDPKQFFEVPMAMPRQLSRPGELDSLIDYQRFPKGVTRIEGRALEVRQTEVELEDGRILQFDMLVIATGTNYKSNLVKPTSGSAADRLAHYQGLNRDIVAAHTILIVGGGPIAVEVAGEILEEYPGKALTIIERQSRLLPTMPAKVGMWAQEFLQERGGVVICDDLILQPEAPLTDVNTAPGIAVTQSGKEIKFDMALWFLGARPQADYLKNHFPEAINDAGEIKIDAWFRIGGRNNMFAVGDVTDLPHKGAIPVHAQMKTALPILRSAAKGLPCVHLASLKPAHAPDSALVSLGRNNGILSTSLGQFRFPWLAKSLKSKAMLVPIIQKLFKVDPKV
jgi:apoptosis-inducing factor 2